MSLYYSNVHVKTLFCIMYIIISLAFFPSLFLSPFPPSGVPIDMVGGTSIGALVGALYCEECSAESVCLRAERFSKKMAAYMDKIWDLTYPSMSMFTGKGSLLKYTGIYYRVY